MKFFVSNSLAEFAPGFLSSSLDKNPRHPPKALTAFSRDLALSEVLKAGIHLTTYSRLETSAK